MKREFAKKLGLNKAQLEAVTAPLGPVLILAGAGSGKTRALTMRIVYLIKKLGMRPENILAVTFTNKAAGEMKERVKKFEFRNSPASTRRQGEAGKFEIPTMGTFHSIGARILRAEGRLMGLKSDFVIYDTDDAESLLKEILIQQRIDPIKFKPSLFSYIIDRAKNNLQEPEDIDYDDNYDKKFGQMARKVYSEYQLQLNKNNAADFGDLIMLPVKIFQAYPEVLKKYQGRWQYILVDEYQDTNHAQYVFTKLLAQGHKNIFVVGDDAQAIYGFRGANLQNILDFGDDYPDAKIIRLEQNYRSTASILSVAEKVIAQSKEQHKKKLWTENEEGAIPVLYRAEDEMAEAWFVGKTIIDLQDNPPVSPLILRGDENQRQKTPSLNIRGGRGELSYEDEDAAPILSGRASPIPASTRVERGEEDGREDESILSRIMRKARSRILPKLQNRQGLNNIVVLYRTHAQSRALEEMLISASIPYQIVGGLKFYERREIKDMLAYLRLLINPMDIVSLKRVINVPPRGIGPKTFEILKDELLAAPVESKDPSRDKASSGWSSPLGTRGEQGGLESKPSDLTPPTPSYSKRGLPNALRQTIRAALPNNDKLQGFFNILETISNLSDEANILDILRNIMKLTGYEAYLKDGTEEGDGRLENIQELFNVAASFQNFAWKEGLSKFLEEVALMTSVDELDLNSPKVTLMTLHQAKGLEFDIVFLIGLEEGLLPHAKSILEAKDIAEEIRLAYVGVTRAKKQLYLVHALSRKQYGLRNTSVPSRILKGIPEELLDIYGDNF
ncbi:MAG: UvrD-helicase domain-containing protein [Candidatus Doudnabacteria bacterium]|nr:UvrD-helicase domain-containing protein [Candidatus Doudnabacteria bacterium]